MIFSFLSSDLGLLYKHPSDSVITPGLANDEIEVDLDWINLSLCI